MLSVWHTYLLTGHSIGPKLSKGIAAIARIEKQTIRIDTVPLYTCSGRNIELLLLSYFGLRSSNGTLISCSARLSQLSSAKAPSQRQPVVIRHNIVTCLGFSLGSHGPVKNKSIYLHKVHETESCEKQKHLILIKFMYYLSTVWRTLFTHLYSRAIFIRYTNTLNYTVFIYSVVPKQSEVRISIANICCRFISLTAFQRCAVEFRNGR